MKPEETLCACGARIVQTAGKGRMRKRCEACSKVSRNSKPAVFEKTCAYCGRRFMTPRDATLTCPGKCSVAYRYARQGKTLKGTVRQCVTCGKDFEPGYKGQKNCGTECATAYVIHRNTTVGRKKANRTCEWCGSELYPRRGQKDANRFCSRECAFKSRQAEPAMCKVYPRSCDVCGRVFIGRSEAARLCSAECRKEDRAIQFKAQYVPTQRSIVEARCAECGKLFRYETGGRGQLEGRRVFCSKKCGAHDGHRRRKVRTPSGRSDVPRFMEVWDRYNGKCGICGLPAFRHLKTPHPLSATIDHIWPVSKYGSHTEDNVQIAHFFCNCAKGTMTTLTDGFRSSLRAEIQRQIDGMSADWSMVSRLRRPTPAGYQK